MGSSLLSAAGIPELICNSNEEYEEMAVTLAEDSEKLFTFRRKLERSRNSCAAFDTERWVKNLETGFNDIMGHLEHDKTMEDIYIEDILPVALENDENIL